MSIDQFDDALIPTTTTRRSVDAENKPTPYHTACDQELEEPSKKRIQNDTISDVPRKLSKLDISQAPHEEQASPITTKQSWENVSPCIPPNFQPNQPDFKTNKLSFGFLQSLSPCFDSAYLYESSKDVEERERAGFLLGRSPTCDLVFDDAAVSKRHCLIYMETGSQGQNRGIRIYLRDMSFNGTYVNNSKIHKDARVVLRNNDLISLRVPEDEKENDWRRPVYRIIFPKSYDAFRCENMYTMERSLGSGSFATVFAAKEKATGNHVAIKRVLRSKYNSRPKLLQSIMQETNTLMTLERHPFVIKIHKTFLEEKYFYFVLEYAPDGDLFNYISENQIIPERKARFIFWQLFSAMQFVHSRGVAHRDLKPENVLMINKDRLHIKIADFGLARYAVGNECFTSQCGTPNYVAPEVLSRGTAYNERCDIWSLGVILYICLCGYTPFNENSNTPMRDQIVQGEYDFNTAKWVNITNEAKALVRELMTVEASKRIELLDALEHPWMKLEPRIMTKYKNTLGVHHIERATELLNLEELSCTMRM